MRYVLGIVSLTVLLLSCTEFFFPRTGEPSNSFLSRATPDGVVDQLIDAYESQRIELIEDLLADSFQFYVAPTFESRYESKYSYFDPEPVDTTLKFIINKDYYYYWKRKNEIERTKIIFENTISSEFTYEPDIADQAYTINSNGDTIAVELLLIRGILKLVTKSRDVLYVDVHNQVFFLNKDSEGLWLIRKWYDCSPE